MKTSRTFRQVLQRTVLLSGLFFIATATLMATMPRSVYAVGPVDWFDAKTGQPCELPDGSQGVTVKYTGNTTNVTCCPQQYQDSIACLYNKYINPAVNLMSALVGILVVIGIVIGAIQYVTSGGDPQKAAAGRKRIAESLIGLAAFFLLYAFLRFVIPGGLH